MCQCLVDLVFYQSGVFHLCKRLCNNMHLFNSTDVNFQDQKRKYFMHVSQKTNRSNHWTFSEIRICWMYLSLP